MDKEHAKRLPHYAIITQKSVMILDKFKRAMFSHDGNTVLAMPESVAVPFLKHVVKREAYTIVPTERTKVLVRWYTAARDGGTVARTYLLPEYTIKAIATGLGPVGPAPEQPQERVKKRMGSQQ
jgi:hypothetical protein